MTHEVIWKLLAIEPTFRKKHAPIVRRRLLSAGKAIKQGRARGASVVVDKGSRFFLHPVDMSAINQCLHLASTVLLLGTDSERLKEVVNKIKAEPALSELDPTTIVTIVVLFNLLLEMRDRLNKPGKQKVEDELNEPGVSPEQRNKLSKDKDKEQKEERLKLEHIARRFGELNWMINSGAVDHLHLKWT